MQWVSNIFVESAERLEKKLHSDDPNRSLVAQLRSALKTLKSNIKELEEEIKNAEDEQRLVHKEKKTIQQSLRRSKQKLQNDDPAQAQGVDANTYKLADAPAQAQGVDANENELADLTGQASSTKKKKEDRVQALLTLHSDISFEIADYNKDMSRLTALESKMTEDIWKILNGVSI